MPLSPADSAPDPTPEPTVEPTVAPTGYQRKVAALNAHRPNSLPAAFLGKVPKPHERVKAQAEIVRGQTAAEALEVLIRPNNKIDPGVARRAMDMLFPKDRPLQLALPDASSPAAFDQAMRLIHEAWTSGKITPSEAETCMRLVNARYRGWLKSQAVRGR